MTAAGLVAATLAVTAFASAHRNNGPDYGTPTLKSFILVGDSIVNGNKPGIEAAFTTAGLSNWRLNTQSGRMITTNTTISGSTVISGLAAVDQVRAQGFESALWVIELGTNNLGMIKNCGCADKQAFAVGLIEQMRQRVGPSVRTAWVTVRANSDTTTSVIFNNALRQVAAANSNFTIIDWYALSSGKNWFLDGVHPNLTGVSAFGKMLADGIAAILPTIGTTTTTTAAPTTTTTTTTIPLTAINGPAVVNSPAVRVSPPTTTTTTIPLTPAQRCGTITTTISYGATGAAVRTVQCALALAGFSPGPIDGAFGNQTRNAVIAFQTSRGQTITGTVNLATGQALGIR